VIGARNLADVLDMVSDIRQCDGRLRMSGVPGLERSSGALGLTDATLLSYWYRHERAARIYDGPDEVHKMVVARAELKKYGRQDLQD